MNTNEKEIENQEKLNKYEQKLVDCERAREGILQYLAATHQSLVELSQAEQEVKSLRKELNNASLPEELEARFIVGIMDQNQQVKIPIMNLWKYINSAMREISTLNGPSFSNATEKLPAIFKHTNRINLLSGKE